MVLGSARMSTKDIELFPCGSKSSRSVLRPFEAKAAERLMAVVVLPTPPFWFVIARITEIQLRSADDSGQVRCRRADIYRKLLIVKALWLRGIAVAGRDRLHRVLAEILGIQILQDLTQSFFIQVLVPHLQRLGAIQNVAGDEDRRIGA